MKSCLSKVTPSFCFAFKIPDDVAASSIYSNYILLLNEIFYLKIIWHKMLSNSPQKNARNLCLQLLNLMRQADGQWFPAFFFK